MLQRTLEREEVAVEIRLGHPPVSALTVENQIRNYCQHYGYPEAVITLNPMGELVLKLHEIDPLPGLTVPPSKTSPKC